MQPMNRPAGTERPPVSRRGIGVVMIVVAVMSVALSLGRLQTNRSGFDSEAVSVENARQQAYWAARGALEFHLAGIHQFGIRRAPNVGDNDPIAAGGNGSGTLQPFERLTRELGWDPDYDTDNNPAVEKQRRFDLRNALRRHLSDPIAPDPGWTGTVRVAVPRLTPVAGQPWREIGVDVDVVGAGFSNPNSGWWPSLPGKTRISVRAEARVREWSAGGLPWGNSRELAAVVLSQKGLEVRTGYRAAGDYIDNANELGVLEQGGSGFIAYPGTEIAGPRRLVARAERNPAAPWTVEVHPVDAAIASVLWNPARARNAIEVAVSPDGRWAAWTTDVAANSRRAIVVADLTSFPVSITRVSPNTGHWYHDPEFHPQFPRIREMLFARSNNTTTDTLWRICRGVFTYNTGTTVQAAQITAGNVSTLQSTGSNRFPSYHPNGLAYAFISDRTTSGRYDLYTALIGGATSPAALVSGTAGTTVEGSVGRPHWSPRGDMIAYAARQGGQRNISVVETNFASPPAALGGPNPRRITGFPPSPVYRDEHPRFSPDGEWVYFVRRDAPGGNIGLFRVRPDNRYTNRWASGTATPEPLDRLPYVLQTDLTSDVNYFWAFGLAMSPLDLLPSHSRLAEWNPGPPAPWPLSPFLFSRNPGGTGN